MINELPFLLLLLPARPACMEGWPPSLRSMEVVRCRVPLRVLNRLDLDRISTDIIKGLLSNQNRPIFPDKDEGISQRRFYGYGVWTTYPVYLLGKKARCCRIFGDILSRRGG